MSWFQKIFTKGNSNNSQQLESPRKQDFTNVMQAVAGETIMAMAQWLISLVNESLEQRATAAGKTEVENTEVTARSTIEELLPKVTTLIEQLHDRSQAMVVLENRIGTVEKSLEPPMPKPTANSPANSKINAKELIEQINQLTEQKQQTQQTIKALENRILFLEKQLDKYSVLPKLFEQQRQAIATLQDRLITLESSHNNSYKTPIETLEEELAFKLPIREWSETANSSQQNPTH